MPITPAQRAELRRLLERTTPGPWEIQESFHGDAWEVRAPDHTFPVCSSINANTADLEFIVAVRRLLPALLEEE
jgi:hypothetical protein